MRMTYIQDYNPNKLSVTSECFVDHIGIHVAKFDAFWKDITVPPTVFQ